MILQAPIWNFLHKWIHGSHDTCFRGTSDTVLIGLIIFHASPPPLPLHVNCFCLSLLLKFTFVPLCFHQSHQHLSHVSFFYLNIVCYTFLIEDLDSGPGPSGYSLARLWCSSNQVGLGLEFDLMVQHLLACNLSYSWRKHIVLQVIPTRHLRFLHVIYIILNEFTKHAYGKQKM